MTPSWKVIFRTSESWRDGDVFALFNKEGEGIMAFNLGKEAWAMEAVNYNEFLGETRPSTLEELVKTQRWLENKHRCLIEPIITPEAIAEYERDNP